MIEYRVYTEDRELLITSLSGLRPAPTGIILYVYYLFRSCTRFVSKGLVWKPIDGDMVAKNEKYLKKNGNRPNVRRGARLGRRGGRLEH